MSEKIFVHFDPFRLEGDEDQVATKFEFVLPDIEVTVPLQDTIWDLLGCSAKTSIPLSFTFSVKTPVSVSDIVSGFADTEEIFLRLSKTAIEEYNSGLSKVPKKTREKIGLYAMHRSLQ